MTVADDDRAVAAESQTATDKKERRERHRFLESRLFVPLLVVVALIVVPAPVIVATEFISLSNRVSATSETAYVQTCHALNRALSAVNTVGHDNGDSVQVILQNIVDRSTSSTRATLASPSSTQQQKDVARANLANVNLLLQQAKDKIKSNNKKIDAKTAALDCTYPPNVKL